jgi:hypothetical protein
MPQGPKNSYATFSTTTNGSKMSAEQIDSIYKLLQQGLSNDPLLRKHAETQLVNLQSSPGFCSILSVSPNNCLLILLSNISMTIMLINSQMSAH